MKYIVSVIRILFLALLIFLLINSKPAIWLGLFVISLLAAVIFGRIYCGYACPMNTVMIPADRLAKKLKLQTPDTPKWLQKGYFAWIFLIISVAAMLLSKRLLRLELPVLLIWVIVSFLVTLRYRPAIFHNQVCPFGALQKLFGRSSMFSVKVDPIACIGCKLCEKVCPSEAIVVLSKNDKAFISTGLCHQCTNCRLVCPKNTILFTRQSKL